MRIDAGLGDFYLLEEYNFDAINCRLTQNSSGRSHWTRQFMFDINEFNMMQRTTTVIFRGNRSRII